MSPQEHRDIIDHVGRLLNEQGLGTLHSEALDAGQGADYSGEYCARYLDAVAAQLEVRSRGTYESALALARTHIATEDGQPVQDIVVALSNAEREMTGRAEVSLRDSIDLSALIATLRDAAAEVRQDAGPSQ